MKTEELSSIKNVVVGVDFSKYSRIIFKQAKSLAKKFGARLYVLHVSEDPVYIASPNLYTNAYTFVPPTPKEVLKSLKRFYNIRESADLSIVLRQGVVYKNILQVAKTLKNPLIVMGSVGQSTFERYLLGSQSEQVALKSPYPVWVHRGTGQKSFKNILIPVDFSRTTEKVIGLFKKISPRLKLRLNYLFVSPETNPFLDFETYIITQKKLNKKLQKFIHKFQGSNPQIKLKTSSGNAAAEIVRVSKKGYDVILMSPHNRSGLFKTFGKVTSKVIRLAPIPVLIIKP